MGGFYLRGPTLCFNSKPTNGGRTCRCFGWNAGIDQTTETMLANDEDKTLKVDLLSLDLQESAHQAHLGEEMGYTVTSLAEIKQRHEQHEIETEQAMLYRIPLCLEDTPSEHAPLKYYSIGR